MHWGELELQNVIRNNLRFTLEVNIGCYIATTVQLNFETMCSRYYNAIKIYLHVIIERSGNL